jgi:hypothetical protein
MPSCKNVLFHGCKKPQRVRLEHNIKRVKQLKLIFYTKVSEVIDSQRVAVLKMA